MFVPGVQPDECPQTRERKSSEAVEEAPAEMADMVTENEDEGQLGDTVAEAVENDDPFEAEGEWGGRAMRPSPSPMSPRSWSSRTM